jgi:hypothetical protein
MRGDISVAIGIGNDTDFAVTNDNCLLAHHKYAPGMGVSIMLGRLTEKRLDFIIECLERLRCHAVPE